MDRMGELEAFVRIVEAGGIGAAAERMGLAKSAVSRRLKDLEARLGARLVNRTTRRLSLTETGRAYYQRAARILADLDEADQAAAQVHGSLEGTLRVGAPMSFGLLHLAPALGGFMSAHPGLTIDIDLNDRRVDVIEEGFDVVVRIGRLADSSLIARRLARVRLVLTASPDYLALHGTPRTVEDLSLHRRLTYAIGGARQRWTCRTPDGREVQIDLADRMIANNGDILGCAAEAGLGLALNPTFIAHRAIEEGRLVPLLTDHSWPSIDAYALYPPGRHLSAKVRAFIDFLADRFGDPPYWDRCLEASTAAGGA